MESPAGRLAAYECAYYRVGQRGNKLPDPRRRGALPAFDRQKRLGHCDGDLAGLETHHRTVAADDLVLRKRGRRRNADVSERGRAGNRRSRYFSRDLHVVSSTLFCALPGGYEGGETEALGYFPFRPQYIVPWQECATNSSVMSRYKRSLLKRLRSCSIERKASAARNAAGPNRLTQENQRRAGLLN